MRNRVSVVGLLIILALPLGCQSRSPTDGDTFETEDALSGTGGLRGEYFNGMSFEQLVSQRTDARVKFTWSTGSPMAGVGADHFSVRWTGTVQPLYSETYTFLATTDDGVRLWVNDQLVIDHWDDHPATTFSGDIPLSAGTAYSIRMEYYESAGNACATLSWKSARQKQQVIPSSRLSPPTTAPAPTASPDGTTVPPAPSIVDDAHQSWTLTPNQQIARNGQVDPITADVTLLLYFHGVVYQQATSQNLWWAWEGGSWVQILGDPRAVSCVSDCAGKQCGDDGCGGRCGSCGAGATCDGSGQCVPSTQDCTGITLNPGDSLQAAIDAHGEGTTFCLAAGIWHGQQIFSMRANDQFIGDPGGGTTLTGDDNTPWLYTAADATGVLWKNITVEHYGENQPECYLGAMHGPRGWTFDHDTFQQNSCTGLGLGSGSRVIGGQYLDNGHAGIESGGQDDLVIQGAEIARNNTRHDDVGNDAAGVKACSSHVQLLSNYVHDNYATGLWSDCGAIGWTMTGNTITGNLCNGIQFETSDGATISHNVVNDNGVGCPYGAGQIYVGQSSANADVFANNVRVPDSGAWGIIVQAEARNDAKTTTNDTVHDNIVTFVGAQGVTGFWNTGGPIGTGNDFDSNTYYVRSLGDAHWNWMSFDTLDWNTYRAVSGQDASSTLRTGNGSVGGCPHTDCSGDPAH